MSIWSVLWLDYFDLSMQCLCSTAVLARSSCSKQMYFLRQLDAQQLLSAATSRCTPAFNGVIAICIKCGVGAGTVLHNRASL